MGEISIAIPRAIHPLVDLSLGCFEKICRIFHGKEFILGPHPRILGEHGSQVFGCPSDNYFNFVRAMLNFQNRQNQT
jgi:hypothetical protein